MLTRDGRQEVDRHIKQQGIAITAEGHIVDILRTGRYTETLLTKGRIHENTFSLLEDVAIVGIRIIDLGNIFSGKLKVLVHQPQTSGSCTHVVGQGEHC